MKPEDKKYILERLGKESIKEISRKLGLKEARIKKFLEKERKEGKEMRPYTDTKSAVKKKRVFLCITLIIALGFVVYSNSLHGEFIWDDINLIRDNVFIKNHSYFPKLFTEHIGKGGGGEYFAYRPLQMAGYALNYYLSKLDVRAYHLTNMLLHISVALCIYWLINILFKNNTLSFFTALLFVVHPIHTGAVSYISGRADPQAALFILLCLILYIKNLEKNNIITYVLMPLFYICAVLSRENALALLFLLPLYHYTFKKGLKIKNFLPVLGVAVAYAVFRLTVLKHLFPHTITQTTLLQRTPGFFAAITYYVKLLLLPFNLHMEYGYRQFSFSDPAVIAGAVILFWSLKYALAKKKKQNLIPFAIFWFFIALMPQSNLYPLNAYMAEHWLYIPSIGFFLIGAWGLNLLYAQKGLRILAIFSIASLLAFYSFLTIRQNEYWQKQMQFYEKTLRYAPYSPRFYNNLAVIYREIGRKEEAISLLKKAIELGPLYAEAYNSLGILYQEAGRNLEAIPLFEKAVELNPSHAGAYSNLAVLYCRTGKEQEALPLFRKALEINPNFVDAYYNFAIYYGSRGNNEEAINLYKKLLEINPLYAQAYNNMGGLYQKMGKREEAVSSYKKALEINPRHVEAYSNLGVLYKDMGNTEEAMKMYKKAIEIDPGFANAHYNLGLLYKNMGKIEEAIASYKKALEIAPNFGKVYNNLAVIYYDKKQYALAIEYCDKALELGVEVNKRFLEELSRHRLER